jgi:transposase
MGDATTLLFGLDGFRVVSVTREHTHDGKHDIDVRQVVVEGVEDEQACPDCGVLSGKVHGRKLRLVKDLPHGRRPLRLWWQQRRWACQHPTSDATPTARAVHHAHGRH